VKLPPEHDDEEDGPWLAVGFLVAFIAIVLLICKYCP